jgi:hypothetical protein
MKTPQQNIFILLLLAYVATSCLTEVSIELPEFEEQVVVNSILCTSDKATAYLSTSYSTGDLCEGIENAMVTINCNNTLSHQLVWCEPEYYSPFYQGGFIPQAGNTYYLSAVTPEGDTLTAQCSIPNMVNIDTFYYQQGIPEYEGDHPIILKIKFTDPGELSNYYMVGYSIYGSKRKYDPSPYAYGLCGFLYNGYDFTEEYSPNLDTNEPLIGEIKYGEPQILCFNDTEINGSSYTLSIGITDIHVGEFDKAILIVPRLYSISEETYWYYESINSASENYDSYIAEHSKQYSNIKGGLGFFGGMAMASDTFFVMKEDFY